MFALRPTGHAAGSQRRHGNATGAPHEPKESTLNIAIAPLISKNMEQIGRLIIFDDVTDRAELSGGWCRPTSCRASGAGRGRRTKSTPLAVISIRPDAGLQVAWRRQKSKLLEKIAKQTFRASEIVNSTLNFSRTSTTEFGEVSVNRVIQETLSLLEHQMQKAGLDVRTALDDTTPTIAGNPGKLQQVFLNLFINARDAMTPGGVLEVKTSHDDDGGVQIDVLDSGHGIDPEHIHRIYDPFFTTQGSAQRDGPRPVGHIRYHSGAWWRHQGLQQARRRHPLPLGVSSGDCQVQEAGYCLKMPEAILKSGDPMTIPEDGKGHVLVIDDEADIRESLRPSVAGGVASMAQNAAEGGMDFAV
jgi:hypothetical protein